MKIDWENAPDGTYIEMPDLHLLPVTPSYGYFVAVTHGRAYRSAPFLGVWTAPDGEKFLDRVIWTPSIDRARRLGYSHDQQAIWDCEEVRNRWQHDDYN